MAQHKDRDNDNFKLNEHSLNDTDDGTDNDDDTDEGEDGSTSETSEDETNHDNGNTDEDASKKTAHKVDHRDAGTGAAAAAAASTLSKKRPHRELGDDPNSGNAPDSEDEENMERALCMYKDTNTVVKTAKRKPSRLVVQNGELALTVPCGDLARRVDCLGCVLHEEEYKLNYPLYWAAYNAGETDDSIGTEQWISNLMTALFIDLHNDNNPDAYRVIMKHNMVEDVEWPPGSSVRAALIKHHLTCGSHNSVRERKKREMFDKRFLSMNVGDIHPTRMVQMQLQWERKAKRSRKK